MRLLAGLIPKTSCSGNTLKPEQNPQNPPYLVENNPFLFWSRPNSRNKTRKNSKLNPFLYMSTYSIIKVVGNGSVQPR
jgi:hypothetical protein